MTGWRWNTLRVLFLTAIAAGAWLSLRDSTAEIADALAKISGARLGAALAVTCLGLGVTGWVWRLGLESVEPVAEADVRTAQSVFFVGQLGKYIPGSVWSFGAQAVLAGRAGMGPRATVTASGLFLAVHVASGLLIAGLIGGPAPLETWMRCAMVLLGVVPLLPIAVRRVGVRLAGTECAWRARTSLAAAGAMSVVWVAYAGSLALLAGTAEEGDVRVLLTGFAVAHAAGVLVPLAPAGLGAREVVFITLVAPALGTGQAAALAIVSRIVQTAADLLIAGAAAVRARSSRTA